MINYINKILKALIINITDSSYNFIAIANPFKYIYIDPLQIQYHCPLSMATKRELGSKLLDWGKVIDGNWDLKRRELLKISHQVKLISEHFCQNVPWEKTQLFALKLKNLYEKGKVDGCINPTQLLERYHKLDILWSEIKITGTLKSAEERECDFDDLFVTIGRDGRYMLSEGGSHRLAMAQLCGIKIIPVRVVFRHYQWQLKRISLFRRENIEFNNHPDFDDLYKIIDLNNN
jgi:hypothetical protein